MFIRQTIKSVKKKKYFQHQLIESIRTTSGPRQNLVLNLGSLDLPKNQWKELANAIEGEMKKQQSLFSPDPEVQRQAKHYAGLIIKKRLKKVELSSKESGNQESTGKIRDDQMELSRQTNPDTQKFPYVPHYETIDINSQVQADDKTIGAEHIVLSQIKKYGLEQILNQLGLADKDIKYTQMQIIGRAVWPSSERETARWLEKGSATKELLGTEIKVTDKALHSTANLLWKNSQQIEEQLSEKAKQVHSLSEDIILYDLTNTFFAGRKQGSRIAKRGKSKERRYDRPLVTLALTVDDQGFPKSSRVLEGNVSEPGTLTGLLDQLELQLQANGPLTKTEKTIVIDAGIATRENLAEIDKRQLKYLAVSRGKKYTKEFWQTSQEQQLILNDDKSQLRVKLVRTETESFLLVRSEQKEAKEQAWWQTRLEKFESELNRLNQNLRKKRTRKKYDYILEKIGRLKERYGVGNLYHINVTKHQQYEQHAGDISWEKTAQAQVKETSFGEYVIRTNRLDLNEEQISRLHRSLTTVEASFRSMKSELGIRPNYHQNDQSVKAHIFITVLAYHMIAGVIKNLLEKGCHYQWDTIRKMLNNHIRTTNSFKNIQGDTVHIRETSRPEIEQAEIYSYLGISHQPIGKKIYQNFTKSKKLM